VTHGNVERFGGDVLFGAIGDGAFETGRDGLDDGGMEEARVRRPSELIRERARLLGGDVETKYLDRY
jgi:hypothetical protein